MTPANWPAYGSYKESGIEWIGSVPAAWSVERGKWLFVKKDRPTRLEDEVVTCFRDGQVTLRRNRRTDGFTNALKEHGYQGIRKGDLVIHAMDAFAGAIGVSDSDGKATPVYSACVPRQPGTVDPHFYAYYMRHLALSGLLVSLAKGIRERSTDFRYGDFADLQLVAPPLAEQRAISAFLDEKCAKVDEAVRIKEEQIALLRERRQILIQEAVTRGLNPDAPMKESGIEWLGPIPSHWKLLPLKFIAQLKSGETISSERFTSEGFPVFGGNGFRGYTDAYTHEGDFVLIGRQGALCGNVNYASGRFFASEHAIVATPRSQADKLWLGELIRSANLNRLSQSAAQPGLSVEVVGNQRFPYAPFVEQVEIGNYVEEIANKFDVAIALKSDQISTLKEYKTTLINAAVTGKIKVA